MSRMTVLLLLVLDILFGKLTSLEISSCDSFLSPLNGTDVLPEHFPKFLRNDSAPFGVDLNTSDGLYFSNISNLRPWRRLLNNLQFGGKERLNLVFFGGSMTAGHFPWFLPGNLYADHKSPYSNADLKCSHQCSTTEFMDGGVLHRWNGEFGQGDCHACAYPARFGDWLSRAYPKVNVTVRNMAVGATDSSVCIDLFGELISDMRDVDVAMISYSRNDFCSGVSKGESAIAAGYEELVRLLMNAPSAPVVIDLEMNTMCCSDRNMSTAEIHWCTGYCDSYCQGSRSLRPITPQFGHPGHLAVARHYRLPIISYDSLVLTSFSGVMHNGRLLVPPPTSISGSGTWSHFGFSEVHPPWPYHQLVADALAYTWRHQAVAVCREATPHMRSNEALPLSWDRPESNGAEFSIGTEAEGAPASTGNLQYASAVTYMQRNLPPPMPELHEIRETLFSFCLHHLTFVRVLSDGTASVAPIDPTEIKTPLLSHQLLRVAALEKKHQRQHQQPSWPLQGSANGDKVTPNMTRDENQHEREHDREYHHKHLTLTRRFHEVNISAIQASFSESTSTAAGRGSESEPASALLGHETHWQFGEDVKGSGKRGWWIDSSRGGRISFPVKLPAEDDVRHGRSVSSITIGFLERYEGMGGVAFVYLDDDLDHTVRIDALSRSSSSQPRTGASTTQSVRLCWGLSPAKQSRETHARAPEDAFAADPPAGRRFSQPAAESKGAIEPGRLSGGANESGRPPVSVVLQACSLVNDKASVTSSTNNMNTKDPNHGADNINTSNHMSTFGIASQSSSSSSSLRNGGSAAHPSHSYKRWGADEGVQHTLHIEVLPLLHRERNKFKLMYIGTC